MLLRVTRSLAVSPPPTGHPAVLIVTFRGILRTGILILVVLILILLVILGVIMTRIVIARTKQLPIGLLINAAVPPGPIFFALILLLVVPLALLLGLHIDADYGVLGSRLVLHRIDLNLIVDTPNFDSLIITAGNKHVWLSLVAINLANNVGVAHPARPRNPTKQLPSIALPNENGRLFSRGLRSNHHERLVDAGEARVQNVRVLLVTVESLHAFWVGHFRQIPQLKPRFPNIQQQEPSASRCHHLHDSFVSLVNLIDHGLDDIVLLGVFTKLILNFLVVLILEHFLFDVCLQILELNNLDIAVRIASPANEPILSDRNVQVVFGLPDMPEIPRLIVNLPPTILKRNYLPENYCLVVGARD